MEVIHLYYVLPIFYIQDPFKNESPLEMSILDDSEIDLTIWRLLGIFFFLNARSGKLFEKVNSISYCYYSWKLFCCLPASVLPHAVKLSFHTVLNYSKIFCLQIWPIILGMRSSTWLHKDRYLFKYFICIDCSVNNQKPVTCQILVVETCIHSYC